MRALILEHGHDRAALAAARALSREGWTVGSGTPIDNGLSRHSRAVSAHHKVPTAGAGINRLIDATNEAIAERGYEVVFTCDDATVVGLSLHRDKLHALFPYGGNAGVAKAFDKLALMREAQAAGFAVPHTVPASEAELGILSDGPLVVKPRLTFLDGHDHHVRAQIVSDLAGAQEAMRQMQAAGAEPVLQEAVYGELMAFTALSDRDASIVAEVQQIAELRWPVAVGVSARARTVEVDRQLAQCARRLLKALGWFGLAQMQFILADDGTPRMIDFNGRFYGSIALAIAAGVNLPALWAALATDRPIPAATRARTGVRYQWLAGDLRAGGAGVSGLARCAAALGTFARTPISTHSVWRLSDPQPAIHHFAAKAAGWMSQR